MVDRGKVKVIKKSEIGKVASPPAEPEVRSTRETARDIVSNVSTWVSDFQGRRREETKVALEKFFGNPQPSEL